jgi:hypothetical protein
MVKKENNAAEDELLATNVKYAQEDKERKKKDIFLHVTSVNIFAK